MSQQSTQAFVGGATGTALYTFGQSRYPSIFRASGERPQPRFPYRWWEEDASYIFYSYDVASIKRVLRFWLLSDDQLPRMAFLTRSTPDVDNILSDGLSRQEKVGFARLTFDQKMSQFIRRCQPAVQSRISWGWLPARKDNDSDALATARAIDTESHTHFTRINYEDLVRYSLGYSSNGVDWFFQQHTCFYAYLLSHLRAFPEEIERFANVEHHLRTRSPFAHRAVVQALRGAGHHLDLPDMPPGFEFFAGPIQRLFKELPQNLSFIMMVLSVLGARFERVYLHAGEMSWSRPFSIAHSFLEDIQYADNSAKDFARNLTTSDERDFAALVEEEIFDQDLADRLCHRWKLLSSEVWECCRALPDMVSFIQASLETLLELRNYHTLTAILSGLQQYGISLSSHALAADGNIVLDVPSMVPPAYFYLLEPSQNYAAYRQQYQGAIGIPFLIPHLQEYHEHAEPVLENLHAQLRTVIP